MVAHLVASACSTFQTIAGREVLIRFAAEGSQGTFVFDGIGEQLYSRLVAALGKNVSAGHLAAWLVLVTVRIKIYLVKLINDLKN